LKFVTRYKIQNGIPMPITRADMELLRASYRELVEIAPDIAKGVEHFQAEAELNWRH
jgi:hypothetical protein